MSWTTISVRREVRERIEAFMREKGFVSPSDVITFLFEHYDSRIRLEEKVKELEERISLVEKCMEDVLFAKAPTSTPQAQAPQAPQQPPAPPPAQPTPQPQPPSQPPQPQPQQQSAPPPEPKLIPASELLEAKRALEELEKAKAEQKAGPAEARKAKTKKAGAFKILTAKWIKENTGKDPEEFMREWEEMGYNVKMVGDRVVIASDDVVESVLNELNARNVQGPGALQDVKDKELRRRATAISAAGFIYFDATTKRWKRA